MAAYAMIGGVLVACGSNPPRAGSASGDGPVATFHLPERAGGFGLDRTKVFEDPAYGTLYTYGINAGEPFDVYIYPIVQAHRLDSAAELDLALDQLVEEFASGMDQAIAAKLYSAATIDEDARIEAMLGANCLPGRYRRMLLEKDGVPYASEMYGFATYGSYIKVRISRPIQAYSAARNRAFVDAFMATLDLSINVYVSDPSNEKALLASLERVAREAPAAAGCTPGAR